MEAFSDSVMAVIITIMAFDLRPPAGSSWASVEKQLPGVAVYALSFAFIAIYWNNHHHLLRAAGRISAGVMWANLTLLFFLSLIPVLTEWLRVQYHHALPASMYGMAAIAAALSYTVLVQALIRANGRDSAFAQSIGSDRKGFVSLGIYACGVVLAFVNPWIAYALYAAVCVIWFVPDPRLSRRRPSMTDL